MRLSVRPEGTVMMVAVFATLFAALILGWLGRFRLAIASFVACLALAVGLFLYEIYSPEYGFRMPWIQTESGAGAVAEAIL